VIVAHFARDGCSLLAETVLNSGEIFNQEWIISQHNNEEFCFDEQNNMQLREERQDLSVYKSRQCTRT